MDPLLTVRQYGDYQAKLDDAGSPVVLGKGGFGLTIRAYRTQHLGGEELEDEFAIKLLRKEKTENPKGRADFIQEIHTLRKLRHPNLADYIACGELEDGSTYLVLELCRGGDLDSLVRRHLGALTERLALKVILQVAAGLAEVHRMGLVHRDLKPKNILLNAELKRPVRAAWIEDEIDVGALRFKVTDFGLVVNIAERNGRGGGFAGTRMFASPEQIRQDHVDFRSDIYSLGLTLWFLVKGQGPLTGPNNDSLTMVRGRGPSPGPEEESVTMIKGQRPLPDPKNESVADEDAIGIHVGSEEHDGKFSPEWSTGFQTLLAKMVRKNPAERFGSMREVIEAVQEVLDGLPGSMPHRGRAPGTTGSQRPSEREIKRDSSQSGVPIIGRTPSARDTHATRGSGSHPSWSADSSIIRVAKELIQRPGWVVSPYSQKEQLISGPKWLEGGEVECEETHRKFRLPRQWSRKLEALIIPGVFDRVKSPWVDPPAESEVPAGFWAPGSEFDCDLTGESLCLPRNLPTPKATLVPGEPGTVLPPFTDAKPMRASPTEWVAGNYLSDSYGQTFQLPDELPPLLARGMDRTGFFESPFAPGMEFELTAAQCIPNTVLECPFSHRRLALPPELPQGWRFMGLARGGCKPQVKSPYIPEADQEWTEVKMADWKGGARLRCYRTGLVFYLPESLPALEAQPIAESAGCFLSPYAPDENPLELDGWSCVRGAKFDCPHSHRPLVVPENLPANWRFTGQVDAGRAFWVRSPFIEDRVDALQQVAPNRWKPGAEVECGKTGLPFRLPAELAAPEAMAGDEPGSFASPYAEGKYFRLKAWECIGGKAMADPTDADRRSILLGRIPDEWVFSADVRQIGFGPPEARNPYVESEGAAWEAVSARDWRPDGAVRSIRTGNTFALKPDKEGNLPALRVKAAKRPLWVVSPFSSELEIEIAKEEWLQGGHETWATVLPGVQCRLRLPNNLPLPPEPKPVAAPEALKPPVPPPPPAPVAPPPELEGIDPVPSEGKGSIRSPYGEANTRVEVPGPRWCAGERVLCPETSRFFRLPKDLPPLIGREGDTAGTIWCPYSDRLINVSAGEWEKNGLVARTEFPKNTGLPGQIRLPATLRPLEGIVDAHRPGWVASPFDPKNAFPVDYADWEEGRQLACLKTRKSFVLPAGLPEWILEGEALQDQPGMIQSPYGQHRTFQVRGPDWRKGGIIHCPETTRKIRLPKALPPLEAEAVAEKPGWVRTPYLADRPEVKVPKGKWHSGNLFACPRTGCEFRLPEGLAPLPSGAGNRLLMPVGVAVFLVGAVTAAVWIGRHAGSGRAVAIASPPPAVTPTASPPVSPAPEVAVAPAPEWPTTYHFPKGIYPFETKAWLEMAGKPPIQLNINRSGDGSADIDISPALKSLSSEGTGANPPVVRLEAPPWYRTVTIPFRKAESLEQSYQDQNGNERLQLVRNTGHWALSTGFEFWSKFYGNLRFRAQDGMPSSDDIPEDVSLPSDSGILETGTYTVQFLVRSGAKVQPLLTETPLTHVVIEPDKTTYIPLPKPIPRYLAGIAEFSGMQENLFVYDYNDQLLDCWKPCFILFNEDFTGGKLYVENVLIGPPCLQLLSNLIGILTSLNLYDPKLNQFLPYFEDAWAAIALPKNGDLLSESPQQLLDKRCRLFEDAEKIRSQLKESQLSSFNNVNYIPPMDWFTRLGETFTNRQKNLWLNLVSTCLPMGKGSPSWKEASLRNALNALSATISVPGGESCSGVFVAQDISLLVEPQLDQSGSIGINTKLSWPDIRSVNKPSSLGGHGTIAFKNGKFNLTANFGPENDPNPGTIKIDLQEIPLSGSKDVH